MKKINYFLLLILLYSCVFDSSFQKITDDFEVGYIDLKRNRNVYYKSEGIFRDSFTSSIWKSDKFILTEIIPLDKQNKKDSVNTKYYLIDIEKYKLDPAQINSSGVLLLNNKYNSIIDSLNLERMYLW